MDELYQECYGFCKQIFEETDMYEPGFVRTNFFSLTPKQGYHFHCIDHLPQAMPSKLYFYAFDSDRLSADEKWRKNHFEYLEKFRRCLLTILGYAETIFLDSSFFDYEDCELVKLGNEQEDYVKLDELLIASLNDVNNTIISIPDKSLLLQIGEKFVVYITASSKTQDLINIVALANGIYAHSYQINGD